MSESTRIDTWAPQSTQSGITIGSQSCSILPEKGFLASTPGGYSSCLKEQADKKRAYTKCWNRQLQADAKELFSRDANCWLVNPCSKIPENDQHKSN
ncbi:hypothetical protein ACTXT7_002457 [Hymenolepis weldensis]